MPTGRFCSSLWAALPPLLHPSRAEGKEPLTAGPVASRYVAPPLRLGKMFVFQQKFLDTGDICGSLLIMPFTQTKSAEERFFEKVRKTDSCWFWVGSKLPTGYGRFWDGERVINAHWFLLNPRPIGKQVACHKCDNPSCVNPDHIFVGSYSDNAFDCVEKGRHARCSQPGEKNPNAKLTDDQMLIVKSCPQVFGAKTKLARQFGVSVSVVGKAISSKGWRHLGEPTESHRLEAFKILGVDSGNTSDVVARELTESQAKLAKACPHEYGSASKLARAFNVTIGCIHNIRVGKTWAHLPAPSEEDIRLAREFLSSMPAPKFGRPPRPRVP